MATPSTRENAEHRRHYADAPDLDAVVIGAGFAGLYMLHRLRDMGLSVRVFERGSGVGGTWYWNRYPGARCDTDSVEYSYQFSDALQQEWRWTRALRHTARDSALPGACGGPFRSPPRYPVRDDRHRSGFRRGGGVLADRDRRRGAGSPPAIASWPPGASLPSTGRNSTAWDRFAGEWYHTGAWPHEGVSFAGKRVGIVGTGSSAVQSIPLIAAEARSPHRLPAPGELHRPRPQRPAGRRRYTPTSGRGTGSSGSRPSRCRQAAGGM